MISRMSVPICNHFYVRRASSGRITPFLGLVLLFCPSFVKTLFAYWHEILPRNTRDTKLSYGENLKSLSQLVLKQYWVVTDGWTNRQTELP